jgi:hypothetical protein
MIFYLLVVVGPSPFIFFTRHHHVHDPARAFILPGLAGLHKSLFNSTIGSSVLSFAIIASSLSKSIFCFYLHSCTV